MKKVCSIDGCNLLVKSRGYCIKHYTHLIRNGDPLYKRLIPRSCSIEGCERIGKIKKGYCNMHYKRFIKYGDAGQVSTYLTKGVKCAIDGCEKYGNLIKGFCSLHYARVKRRSKNTTPKSKIGENRVKNPLYKLYLAIKKRCYNIKAIDYNRYGGRGIIMCDERLGVDGFSNFLKDMGDRPKGYTLDRIDNNKGYSASNCRRATRHEQQHNRRNSNKTVGVHYNKNKGTWLSYLKINKVLVLHKVFKTEQDAINARKDAELKYLGNYL